MSNNPPPTKTKFKLNAPSALFIIGMLLFFNLIDWITSALGVINTLKVDPFANITSFIISGVIAVIILAIIYVSDLFLGRDEKNLLMIFTYFKNGLIVTYSKLLGKSLIIVPLSFEENSIVTFWLFVRFIDWYTSFVGMYTWLVKGTSPTKIDFVDFSVFIADKGLGGMLFVMGFSIFVCLTPLILIYFINSTYFDSVRSLLEERKERNKK